MTTSIPSSSIYQETINDAINRGHISDGSSTPSIKSEYIHDLVIQAPKAESEVHLDVIGVKSEYTHDLVVQAPKVKLEVVPDKSEASGAYSTAKLLEPCSIKKEEINEIASDNEKLRHEVVISPSKAALNDQHLLKKSNLDTVPDLISSRGPASNVKSEYIHDLVVQAPKAENEVLPDDNQESETYSMGKLLQRFPIWKEEANVTASECEKLEHEALFSNTSDVLNHQNVGSLEKSNIDTGSGLTENETSAPSIKSEYIPDLVTQTPKIESKVLSDEAEASETFSTEKLSHFYSVNEVALEDVKPRHEVAFSHTSAKLNDPNLNSTQTSNFDNGSGPNENETSVPSIKSEYIPDLVGQIAKTETEYLSDENEKSETYTENNLSQLCSANEDVLEDVKPRHEVAFSHTSAKLNDPNLNSTQKSNFDTGSGPIENDTSAPSIKSEYIPDLVGQIAKTETEYLSDENEKSETNTENNLSQLCSANEDVLEDVKPRHEVVFPHTSVVLNDQNLGSLDKSNVDTDSCLIKNETSVPNIKKEYIPDLIVQISKTEREVLSDENEGSETHSTDKLLQVCSASEVALIDAQLRHETAFAHASTVLNYQNPGFLDTSNVNVKVEMEAQEPPQLSDHGPETRPSVSVIKCEPVEEDCVVEQCFDISLSSFSSGELSNNGVHRTTLSESHQLSNISYESQSVEVTDMVQESLPRKSEIYSGRQVDVFELKVDSREENDVSVSRLEKDSMESTGETFVTHESCEVVVKDECDLENKAATSVGQPSCSELLAGFSNEKLSFRCASSRKNRVENHKQKQMLSCAHCPRQFKYEHSLTEHLKKHLNGRRYSCTVCSKKFMQASVLKCHMRTHSDERRYTCALCSKSFKAKFNLRVHLKTVHSSKKKRHLNSDSSSAGCLRTNSTSELSNIHYDCDKNKRGTAQIILKDLSSEKLKTNPKEQLKSKTNTEESIEDKFVAHKSCEDITKVEQLNSGPSFEPSKSKNQCVSINKHEQKLSCIHCQRLCQFSHKSALVEHSRTHLNEKSFLCTLCPMKFARAFILEEHMKTHSNERGYICTVCSKSFKTKYNLNIHMRVHSDEKPFYCVHCPSKFRTSRHLRVHLLTHTTEKSFQCSQCSKKFKSKDSLKSHLNRHSGEKSYKCSVCSVVFSANSSLYTHMKTHSNDKPFACSQCPKRFKTNGNLKLHLVTHSDDKPYSCPQCPLRCKRKQTLEKHILRSHAGGKQYLPPAAPLSP